MTIGPGDGSGWGAGSSPRSLPLARPTRYRAADVARKKQRPISNEDREVVGRLLREVRRAAGYRSVETAARVPGCPAARQTIYAYERGGFTPSLAQFLELVEFYVLEAPAESAKPVEDLRAQGVTAVVRALSLPAYHLTRAVDLIGRMQPISPARRRRKKAP
jgi:DNA-binding XRE family transcriptional regulator